MTERDVFESRLRAALLRHVEEGPTDFDALGFARTVAAKEPRRHGFTAVLSLRVLAIPRRAWLLLLAGLLLAAMIGGTLLVGSQLQRRLPAVVPPVGQLFECPPGSTPDEPGPVDQARPASPSAMAFDSRAGRLVAIASTLFGEEITGVETWTFDVCTNTWTRMHPNREPSSPDSWLVYDVDSDVTILVTSREVWAYALQADTWTLKDSVPPIDATSLIHVTSWAYDPVAGVIVAAATELDRSRPPELWGYDVASDTWTPIRQSSPAAAASRGVRFAYDASADRLVAFGVGSGLPPETETWLFDLRTGTWSRSGAATPPLSIVWGFDAYPPEMVYDEEAERTVVFGGSGSAAYDAAADRWEVLPEPSSPGGFSSTPVYDPVNGRLVGLGSGDTRQDDVVAFDLASREWTILLEPREGQPTPNPE